MSLHVDRFNSLIHPLAEKKGEAQRETVRSRVMSGRHACKPQRIREKCQLLVSVAFLLFHYRIICGPS